MVPGVSDIDTAIISHGDSPGFLELPIAITHRPVAVEVSAALLDSQIALAAPLAEESAIGVKDLHAVIVRIHHIDVAFGPHGHSPRVIELAWRGTDLAPGAHHVQIDVDIGVRIGRQFHGLRWHGTIIPELLGHIFAHIVVKVVHVIPVIGRARILAEVENIPQGSRASQARSGCRGCAQR